MTRRSVFSALLLLIVAGLVITCSDKKKKSVATINGQSISLPEYRLRAGFTPYIFHGSSPAERNREFALSLVGEKLLAREATKQGLAADPRFTAQMAQLRREFLFEALYAKEVRGQANEDQAMTELWRKIMAGKTMTISHAVFDALHQAMALELEQKPMLKDSTLVMSERNENKIATRHADLLKQTLVRFGQDEHWSVADFLLRLSVGPYPVPLPSSTRFPSGLRGIIKKTVELEFLSRYAEAQGLADSEETSRQVQIWSDALLTQMFMQRVSDSLSVSDADVQSFYQNHPLQQQTNNPPMAPDSTRQQIRRQLRNERAKIAWRRQLQSLPADIWLNTTLLDTLNVQHNANLVVKRHFPRAPVGADRISICRIHG